MKEFTSKVYRVLASPKFIRVVLVFFIFESIWIAVSAVYPQAFDENFHFGLIQVYSHYWLPFLSSQPPHANAFGAVARDPSYLYHYLMSFPYRVIAFFVHRQTIQVILLRIINVGFLATALILFRKILLRVKVSEPLANISILLFALIPIVPQLAAQINYDNLLLPLVAWIILLTFDLTDQIRAKKPTVKTILVLATACFFTSIVKYVFLPIFLGIVIFLAILTLKQYKHDLKSFLVRLHEDWKKQSPKLKILLVSLFILSVGMFAQRDVVNVIKYHTIQPNCATVLSVSQCKSYSAWYYTYTNHQDVIIQKSQGGVQYLNILSYTGEWFYWMWYRLFFVVNGPNSSFTNYPPLPLPAACAVLIALVGLVAIIKFWRKIFHNNIYLVLLFMVSILYVSALFAQGYSSYHYSNVLINMNGRYLLPVLLLLAAIMGKAFSLLMRSSYTSKAVVVCLVLLLFLQGGGFLSFLVRSDNSWDVQNTVVQKANNDARKIIQPVLIKGSKNYSTKSWFFN